MNLDYKIINNNIRKFFNPIKNRPLNFIPIRGNQTKEHFMKMCDTAWDVVVEQGRVVVVDVELKSGQRPDIVCVDLEEPIAYEIMKSETQKSIDKKKEEYPFKLIEVRI